MDSLLDHWQPRLIALASAGQDGDGGHDLSHSFSGAVGLAPLFYIAGRMGSQLAHSADPLAWHRERDDRAYALDPIETTLATVPGKMQTPTGRRLGQERLQELLAFRDRFAGEWA